MLFLIRKPPCQAIIASIANVIVIATFCLPFTKPYFTHALSADSINQEDHNHPKLVDWLRQSDGSEKVEISLKEVENYEPSFVGLDRSIIGRVPSGVKTLGNNAPAASSDLKEGESHYWTLPKEVLLGPLSQSTTGLPFEEDPRNLPQSSFLGDPSTKNGGSLKNLYVTLTTCTQPSLKVPGPGGANPLELYISGNPDNQKPTKYENDFQYSTTEGFVAANLSASGDVFFTVAAPSNDNLNGNYTYELTASIDTPYTAYNSFNDYTAGRSGRFFLNIDSDSESTLLIANLTTDSSLEDQQRIHNSPPYSVFLHKQNDPALSGLQSSLCGLKKFAQFQVNLLDDKNGSQTQIVKSAGGQAEQQFYVNGLDDSSSYYATLAIDGNSTKAGGGVVRGGGTVGPTILLNTKSDKNCALLFNLSFCSNVAYAVPSNPITFPNRSALASFYDDNARALWQNFNYSLQQIPCETPSTAQYSLARNCTDCNAMYIAWLCAVTIPRCEDFSTPRGVNWLQPRNIGQPFYNGSASSPLVNNPSLVDPGVINNSWVNSSRSKRIDDTIKPGPWKEILPCRDLCYDLVQSCPAALGFACPLPGKGLEISYGSRHDGTDGKVTCNHPGESSFFSAATLAKAVSTLGIIVATAATSLLLALELGI